jgi:hypothetical protein
MMQDKGRSIALGGLLILVGAWLLVRALGVNIPGLATLWPVLLIGGALVSLFGALRSAPRDPEGVWFGVAGTLVGGLFLYITAGAGQWGDLRVLWPWFPFAAGLAWLASWLVDTREVADLVWGLLALAGAGIGYLYVQDRLPPDIWRLVANWWPLILVLLGLVYILQYLIQRPRDAGRD